MVSMTEYGSAEVVKRRLNADDGEEVPEELVSDCLKTANAQIKGRLKKNLLKISGDDDVLNEVANYYASAEARVPKDNPDEEENQKAKYWNSRADQLLNEFIEGAIKEQNNSKLDDNPYSVSTTNGGSTYGEIFRD